MDVLRHLKSAVRSLPAYVPESRRARVELDRNESPWELPVGLKRRLLERALARPWSRYPDADSRDLRRALARATGWPADGVLVGSGSNEAIAALLQATVGPGTRVVVPEPTFSMYALLTTVLGGEPVRVPLLRPQGEGEGFAYDVEALLRRGREEDAAVTFVCSPNNPTGNSLGLAEVERVCRGSDSLVVVDEAYHEPAGRSVVPLLGRHPNLVVLRTFSKAMALAGLRVGCLLASPELVREIDKARLPYNLGFLPQAAARAALEARGALRERVRRLVRERERLRARLAGMPGVRVFPSDGSFLLLEFPRAEARDVFASLLRRGVLVRDVTSQPMLRRCLRVSVGTGEENGCFLAALEAALEECGEGPGRDE